MKRAVLSIFLAVVIAALTVGFCKSARADCGWIKPEEHLEDVHPNCPPLSDPAPLNAGRPIKKDLLGFSPGMTETEFKARQERCAGDEEVCTIIRDGKGYTGISYASTIYLSPNVVREIVYRFSSGTPTEEMIRLISEQFNVAPVPGDWDQRILRAVKGYDCGRGFYQCYGGLVSMWRLDRGLGLYLTLNTPGFGGRPNQYWLSLVSDTLAKLEKKAKQQQSEEREMRARAVNPQPRF